MLKVERKLIPIEDLKNVGYLCYRAGCTASFAGVMPPGWKWLFTYYAPKPEMVTWTPEDWLTKRYEDFCLCPEHVREMEALFKDLDAIRELDEKPVAGSA